MNLKNNFKKLFLCLFVIASVFITKTYVLENSSNGIDNNPVSEFKNTDYVTTIKGNKISSEDLNEKINEFYWYSWDVNCYHK